MRDDAMLDVVLLYTPCADAGGHRWSWHLTKDHSEAQSDTLLELGKRLGSSNRSARAVLLIAAEGTLSCDLFVPTTKLAHIRAAAPHLIDEWVISDGEELHLCIGSADSKGHFPAVAMEQSLLDRALSELEAVAIDCQAAAVDAEQLPYTEGCFTLLIDDSRSLFRRKNGLAGAIETAELPPLLAAIFRQQTFSTIQLLVSNNTPQEQIDWIETHLSGIPNSPQNVERNAIGVSLLRYLSDRIASQPPTINLLQGDFAKNAAWHQFWKRWRPLAWSAAALLLFHVSASAISGWALGHRADEVREQSVQLYRELFPGEKRIVNLRQQFQGHLNNTSHSQPLDFFPLFDRFVETVEQSDPDSPIGIQSLIYDKSDGSLKVAIEVSDIQFLDSFRNRLLANSIEARIKTTTSNNGRVVGQLVLKSTSP